MTFPKMHRPYILCVWPGRPADSKAIAEKVMDTLGALKKSVGVALNASKRMVLLPLSKHHHDRR
jgi:hypothetical protein